MTVKRKTSSASDSTPVRAAAKARVKSPGKARAPAGKQAARASASKRAASRTAAAKTQTAKTATKTPIKTRTKTATGKASTGKAAAAKAPRKSGNVVVHQPMAKPAPTPNVVGVVEHALGEMKAANVKVLDVHQLTDIADTMVIASGNSDRHVRAIADRVVQEAKKSGFRPMGVEGERDGEWVLVDLQDVIVHIMLPRVREFYRLESLWDITAARREVVQTA